MGGIPIMPHDDSMTVNEDHVGRQTQPSLDTNHGGALIFYIQRKFSTLLEVTDREETRKNRTKPNKTSANICHLYSASILFRREEAGM